jgi:XTP/dITP diphosphohydrolase
MLPSSITIATSNSHKVEEFQELLRPLGIPVRRLEDASLMASIEETGSSFEENAYIKARIVADMIGEAVLADDSGLEVDALQGQPGVRSARFAGPNATDADNRALLASSLRDQGHTESRGRFRCALAWVDPLRSVIVEGSIDGVVSVYEQGHQGFGYDSMFTPIGDDRTFASMTNAEKNARSHRAAATAALMEALGTSQHPERDDDRRWLLNCAYAATTTSPNRLQQTLQAVRSTNHARAVYEAFLQSYLFLGFPSALESLHALADHCAKHDIRITNDVEATAYDPALFMARGQELCAVVYGSVYDRLIDKLSSVSPDLAAWMILEGYGKTLSRPGLSLRERELCVVIQLAATMRKNQLYSHVRGAYNVGAHHEDLDACFDVLVENGNYDAAHLLTAVRAMVQ